VTLEVALVEELVETITHFGRNTAPALPPPGLGRPQCRRLGLSV
jgi:hypothetical protein